MRLKDFIPSVEQYVAQFVSQGTDREVDTSEQKSSEQEVKQQIADGLEIVRKSNDLYFRVYVALITGAFVLTLAFALFFRSEMGGLAVVLGAGGVVQGGLLAKLATEIKEKARVEIVANLARLLPPQELSTILRDMLGGISK